MKAYGIPRVLDLEGGVDCGDIRRFGLKSAAGNLRGKGGDYHNSFRKSAAKRATRRIFKKLARRAGRAEIRIAVEGE